MVQAFRLLPLRRFPRVTPQNQPTHQLRLFPHQQMFPLLPLPRLHTRVPFSLSRFPFPISLLPSHLPSLPLLFFSSSVLPLADLFFIPVPSAPSSLLFVYSVFLCLLFFIMSLLCFLFQHMVLTWHRPLPLRRLPRVPFISPFPSSLPF